MSIALWRLRSAKPLLTALHRHTTFRRTISSANGAPATKFLETFNEEFEIGNRLINDALRRLIRPMGVLLKKLEEETGARLSVDDGTLTIVAKNQSVMDKILEKVVSIVGRETEIGGIYKGVVTSIKEYGTFVEFNGGKQGLLHISELSYEPVSHVSDVVSIGQQLSLMCIAQDIHGNSKLSLKATLRGPGGSKTSDIAEGYVASAKETAKIWAPVWDASSITREQNSASELSVEKNEVGKTNPSASEAPVILIRSAEECDEKEKSISSNHNQTSNGPLIDNGVQLDRKLKSPSKSKPRKSQDAIDSPSHSGPLPYKNAKKPKVSMQKESKSDTQRAEENKKEGKGNAPLSAEDFKLGTKVNAKVYQIREYMG